MPPARWRRGRAPPGRPAPGSPRCLDLSAALLPLLAEGLSARVDGGGQPFLPLLDGLPLLLDVAGRLVDEGTAAADDFFLHLTAALRGLLQPLRDQVAGLLPRPRRVEQRQRRPRQAAEKEGEDDVGSSAATIVV